MAKNPSAFTQSGLTRAAKALTAAGFVIYGAYLINGGIYLDTSGTIAASAGKASAIIDDDEEEDLWAKKLGTD